MVIRPKMGQERPLGFAKTHSAEEILVEIRHALVSSGPALRSRSKCAADERHLMRPLETVQPGSGQADPKPMGSDA